MLFESAGVSLSLRGRRIYSPVPQPSNRVGSAAKDKQNLISPTSNPSSPAPPSPMYLFGCPWDAMDYSCSYDCVFMALSWIYLHAPRAQQTTWMAERKAARDLVRSFQAISTALQPRSDSHQPTEGLTPLFSTGRNTLRDNLLKHSPDLFKRGKAYITIGDVLDHLAGKMPFTSTVVCRCARIVKEHVGASYMLTPSIWKSMTGSEAKPVHESLAEWLSKFAVFKAPFKSHACSRCHDICQESLSFGRLPWIWFSVVANHPRIAVPSLRISLGSDSYRLAAVIYGNDKHFVARLGTPSGTWHNYDGMERLGRPGTALLIKSEQDLVGYDGSHTICALVYCLVPPSP